MPAGSPQLLFFRTLAALAVAVTLTGCVHSSHHSASPLPRLPSGTPTAAQSSVPSHTTARQQVHAVVERYFEVLNRLHLDMGYVAMSRLFTADCTCREQVRSIRDAAARKERYLDRVRINALRTNLDGPRTADVLADYQLVRGGLVDAAGHRLTRNPPHRVRWDFQLRRNGGTWRIARIDDLS